MESKTVRRCRRCQAPAVIVVNRWEGRLFGVLPMQHSEQTDHRCQSCGAGFSLRPGLLLWFVMGVFTGGALVGTGALGIVGTLVALAVQGPAESVVLMIVSTAALTFGAANLRYLAGPQVHAWRNPIVPGAEVPELRYGPPQGHRRCSCGGDAPRVSQQAYQVVRLPAGTSATHLCPACGRGFTVPDRWALAALSVMVLFLGGTTAFLAALLPFDELRGDHFVVLGVLGVGALVGMVLVVLGLYRRFRHPMR